MLSLAGSGSAPIMALHTLSKARFEQGPERENGLSADEPPAHAGALHPLRDEGLVRRLDHARADGDARLLQGVVAHAMAMLAEEGQLPLDLGPVRRRGAIAKVAQRPDHLGNAAGVVTQDLAVLRSGTQTPYGNLG